MSDPKQEAVERLAEALKVAQQKLDEAQAIADEFALEFSWDLAYGMGGTYEGKGTKSWGNGGKVREHGEWVSSSSTC